MDVETALDLAHSLRKQYGDRHCDLSDCRVCAITALAGALRDAQRDTARAQRASIQLAEHAKAQADAAAIATRTAILAQAHMQATDCPTCQNQLVDGICSNCSL